MKQQELQLFEQRPVRSVTEIVEQLRVQVEGRFRDLWVQGEISNLKRPASGHLYFTLKDEDSQLSAVCFRMQNRYLRFDPEDGMDVIAHGSAGIYVPRGQLQLIVETLEPVGRGALQAAFEQLKKRLEREGLFDPARKRRLPLLPRKVGVISSASGAAFRDILRVLARRNRGVDVLLWPARVQGESAPGEIEAGLRALGGRTDLDAVIVARGGGSMEDLQAFNDEGVARAIFECPVPVISAVGHEIDFTIADFVADLRAATPSAAAELVAGPRAELIERVQALGRRATAAARLQIRERRHRLQRLLTSRGFMDARSRLGMMQQRLDDLESRLTQQAPALLGTRRSRLELASTHLGHQLRHQLARKSGVVERLSGRLQGISPLKVLDRGYALVRTADGRLVQDPAQVAPGELFDVRVAQGEFRGRREAADE